MAVAVDFRTYQPENSRADLVRRIENAPLEHAQALLAAYDLLERLHEKGILDLLNGLLSAGDIVVKDVVEVISSPQAVTALRLGLIFSNLLVSLDVDKVHALIADAEKKPPSLFSIAKQASSEEARRGMATASGLLNILGEALKGSAAKKA